MASEEDHAVYGEEDLDEDEDDDSEEEDLNLPTSNAPLGELDDDVDDDVEEEDDDDTSSSNLAASAGEVTVAVAGVTNGELATSTQGVTVADSLTDPKRKGIEDVTIAAVVEEKKPLAAMDESRKLFQRLWTDEDEIELLQGFLDYTTQRGGSNPSHQHDTTAFYDQIKSKLQLDFNKNQLVEKLRRLKKKYRNVLSKIRLGKDYVFKSPHDQSTFEISRKIWSGDVVPGGAGGGGGGGGEEGRLEDEELNPNHPHSYDHNNNGVDANSSEKKASRPRKRSRGVKADEKPQFNQQTVTPTATSIPNLIEETVKSCLTPLFKELLHNAMNGPCGSRGFGGVGVSNPMPLSFGCPPASALNFTTTGGGGDMMDDKWRKQQILELEVYSKRLELVQDQIKSALEELRSTGS